SDESTRSICSTTRNRFNDSKIRRDNPQRRVATLAPHRARVDAQDSRRGIDEEILGDFYAAAVAKLALDLHDAPADFAQQQFLHLMKLKRRCAVIVTDLAVDLVPRLSAVAAQKTAQPRLHVPGNFAAARATLAVHRLVPRAVIEEIVG